MTLGLTNGTSYAGLAIEPSNYRLYPHGNAYGLTLGSTMPKNKELSRSIVGVTSDPTKSGIVTNLNGINIGNVNSVKLGKYILKY